MGLEIGEFLKRFDDRKAHKIVEGDIGIDLPFFEGFFRFLAKGLDLACVGAEHVGELCGILQGIVHALRDQLAHVAHLHDFEFLAFAGNVGMVGFPCLEVAALDGAGKSAAFACNEATLGHLCFCKAAEFALCRCSSFHVAGDDPSVRAGSCNRVEIDAFLLCFHSCTGGCGSTGYCLGGSCGRCFSRFALLCRFLRCGCGGFRGCACGRCGFGSVRCELGERLAGRSDHHDILQDGNLVAIFPEYCEDGAFNL